MDRDIDYKALGKRIQIKRKEKQLTQEQLSEICDLSAAHIGHIERGTRILSVDVLVKLAKALDVSLDYLLFDSVTDTEILFVDEVKIYCKLSEKRKKRIE